jgi:anti-sigma-K factor RskA
MMSVDAEFAAVVQRWQYRLGVLNQMVGSVEPRPELWENIRTAVGASEPQVEMQLPEAPQPEPAAPEAAAQPPAADPSNLIRLSAQVRRWRGIASFATAIAASLIFMIGLAAYQPDLLPESFRPKARTQLVEVKSAPAPAGSSAQYVAVLQKEPGSPAFILTVDGATKNFTVRKVGAQPEPGKSYELWIVSDKLQRPRSLGVIGGNDFTVRPVLSGYDPEVVNQATYAVTVEPEGGSPSGVATGPIVFTGKLIETVPPAPPSGSKNP